MCGIAGSFRLPGTAAASSPHSGSDSSDHAHSSADEATVRAMMARLERRGPDGDGFFAAGPAVFGHRRLKIIDLTEAGKQPMISHCGRYLMIFNGEIYNYQDLMRELGLRREDLRSTSDSEILLAAWAAWGEAALPKLVGQFAFAIYDRRDERLWLARDRFGEKPLFYHQGKGSAGGLLYFASSIGALLAVPSVTAELDPEALQEYATLRYVVAPRTVVKGVLKLPGGSLLQADKHGVSVRSWFDLHYRDAGTSGSLDKAALAEEFGRLLTQATRRTLVADVRTALLLSDGIDSNAIRTLLMDIDPEAPCFTYGYQNAEGMLTMPRGPGKAQASVRRYEYAFSMADRIAAMPEAFGGLTEPVGDGAALATWLLLHKAKAKATVFLCGHGSDELLGGYRLSQDRLRLRALHCLALLPRALTAKVFDRFLYGDAALAPKLARFRAASDRNVGAAARYLIHRPLPMQDIRELLQQNAAFAPTSYMRTVSELYGKTQPEAPDMNRIQEVMIHTFLSENILSFADSVAMDSSVELRMPFLDRDLVDFVLRLPPAARVGTWPGTGNTKRVLRWWGARHLDAEMVAKRKQTFNFGSLRPMLVEHGQVLRGHILDSSALRRVYPGIETWLGHPPEYYRDCWQGTMWALIALGIWCEKNQVKA